jgi:hypothetical protein
MKSTSEITSESPDARNATARACSLVLVKNVMIAPIKGMRIIKEIRPAI